MAVRYFRTGILLRYFPTAVPAAACKFRREIMELSRHISFAILTIAVMTVSALLLEHSGVLARAFRTEILARVNDGDVVKAADISNAALR